MRERSYGQSDRKSQWHLADRERLYFSGKKASVAQSQIDSRHRGDRLSQYLMLHGRGKDDDGKRQERIGWPLRNLFH